MLETRAAPELPPFPELSEPELSEKPSESELPQFPSVELPKLSSKKLKVKLPSLPVVEQPSQLFQSLKKPKPKSDAGLPPFLPTAKEDLPPFPGELGEELQQLDKEIPQITLQESLKPLEAVLPLKPSELVIEGNEIEREAAKDEQRIVHAREKLAVQKPVFVEGMDFRMILGSLVDIHSILEENEEHLAHWVHKEENKDTHLEHLKLSLEQMQRKLIYIDSVLFE